MPQLLFIDIESYYNSREKYDLKHLSIPEYARDPRFKLHGIGLGSQWISGAKFIAESDSVLLPDWNNSVIVGHNLKFDGFILAERYGIKPLEYRDTKSMSKAVLGRKVEDYKLSTLAKYFGLPEKGVMKVDGIRDLTPEQEKELAEYCLHDVWLCREIYKRLEADFPANQYPLMDQTIRMFVEPKLVLNVPLLEKTAEDEKRQKIEIFKEIGIEKEVFSSNIKFSQLLKDKGYVVPTKRSISTGKDIPALALGDAKFLDLLESKDETLKKLCEARREAKSTLMETRSEKLAKIGRTGAWPFDVEFSGAIQTHRYSGGGSSGGNPQNFTRDSALREAVQAPEGFSLVVGDLSQADARFVAWISQDPGLLAAFKSGDPYSQYASVFFGYKVSKDDKNTKKERAFGKTAILSLGYESGADRFMATVRKDTGQVIDKERAQKAVKFYRTLYSRVPAMWRRLVDFIPELASGKTGIVPFIPFLRYEKNAVILPSGLKLQYWNLRQQGLNRFGKPNWVYDDWGKKGQMVQDHLYGGKLFGHICQACTGEVKKNSMLMFKDKVSGEIHDELILVTDMPEEDRAELEAAMSESPSWLPQLKLQAEVGIGSNWFESKRNT